MKTGEKIKLLRTFNSMSQENLADLIGMKQEHITYIESGKRAIDPEAIKIISDFFGCSASWLHNGKGPVAKKSWIYFNLPSKTSFDRPKNIKTRLFNHISKSILDLFDPFLRENKIKKYSLISVENQKNKFFVFPLSFHSSLILNSDPYFFPYLDIIFNSNKLKPLKQAVIEDKIADLISWPGHANIPAIIKFHDLCGFHKITTYWKKHALENRRLIWGRAVYEQQTNQICRDIVSNRIKPQDIANALEKYCENESELEFAKLWLKLKKPL